MRIFGLALVAALLLNLMPSNELLAVEEIEVSFPSARLYEKDTDTRTIKGYLFTPDGPGPFPAVVLLHANSGVGENLTKDWSGFLTGLRYVVLIPRSNHSRNIPRNSGGNLNTRALAQMKDGYGALDMLATLPHVDAERVAVMGFSRGGNAINTIMYGWKLRHLSGREFKAAIPVYGRCNEIKRGYDPKVNVPVLHIIGELDNLRKKADLCIDIAKDRSMEILVLKGAHHAFDFRPASGETDSGGNHMEYSAEATAKARQATKDFLAKHLGN